LGNGPTLATPLFLIMMCNSKKKTCVFETSTHLLIKSKFFSALYMVNVYSRLYCNTVSSSRSRWIVYEVSICSVFSRKLTTHIWKMFSIKYLGSESWWSLSSRSCRNCSSSYGISSFFKSISTCLAIKSKSTIQLFDYITFQQIRSDQVLGLVVQQMLPSRV